MSMRDRIIETLLMRKPYTLTGFIELRAVQPPECTECGEDAQHKVWLEYGWGGHRVDRLCNDCLIESPWTP